MVGGIGEAGGAEGLQAVELERENRGTYQVFHAKKVYGTDQGVMENVSILVNPDGVIEAIVPREEEQAELAERQRHDQDFRVVERESEVILPSLTDSHNHPVCFPGILSGQPGFIFGITSEDRLRDYLTEHFKEKDRDGSSNRMEMVIGWDTSSLPNITADKLDTVRKEPFIIMDMSYHGAVGNTAAVQKIMEYTRRMGLEGKLRGEMDNQGRMWEEYALLGLEVMETDMDLSEISNSVEDYLQETHRGGAGFVHEMVIFTPAQAEIYASLSPETKKLISQAYLGPRIMRSMTDRGIDVSTYGLKLLADGSFGSFSSLMYEPFVGTDKTGLEYNTAEDAKEAMELAAGHGITRAATHAIGDRGIDVALSYSELWQKIAQDHGLDATARVEHFSIPRAQSIEHARELGVIVSTQPNFATDVVPYAGRLGPERTQRNIPLRQLVDTGVHTCFGTDGMPNSMAFGLHCATTPPNKAQALTFEEALKAAAQTAPMLEGTGRSGVIRVGASADFVLTNQRFIDKVTSDSGLFDVTAGKLDEKMGEVKGNIEAEIGDNLVGGQSILKKKDEE